MAETIVLAGGSPRKTHPRRRTRPAGIHLQEGPQSLKRLLRIKEAAGYLNVSQWKVRCWVQSGRLPYFQDGANSLILLDVEDLQLFVLRNKQREGEQA